MGIQTHMQRFFHQASVSGWETNPKELCWLVVQSHPPVSAERTGKWAQAVPVPHAQAMADQPLDNVLPSAWIVPGHGLEWIVALTKERAVLCQLWLDNKFLESL